MSIVREQLINKLLEGEVQVTFVKQNGKSTNMRCTLSPDIIPPEHFHGNTKQQEIPLLGHLLATPDPMATVLAHKKPVKGDDNHIVVWSIDRNAWRSFRLERVTFVLFQN
jgi:hypothetical protein